LKTTGATQELSIVRKRRSRQFKTERLVQSTYKRSELKTLCVIDAVTLRVLVS
jgi:hypothetical protein